MSIRALCVPLAGLALLFAATEVAGQRICDLTTSDGLVLRGTIDERVSYVSVPRIECDDGTTMRADSSVHFEATSFSQLFGSVVFRDDRQELHADRAQYFENVGRLQAQGSVRLLNIENGSWVTGEDLVLLQEDDDRAEDDVTVRGGRPHASLVSRATPDSTALAPGDSPSENSQDATPYEVDADLIHLVGDRLFQARGRVEINQETMQSYGDSLEFHQDIGWLTLFDNARILSQDTVSGDTLDVRGDTITMNLPDDQIDEIEALGRAHLLADDVDMRGPVIRLLFENEEVERVFAVRRAVEEVPAPEIGGDDESAASADQAQPRALAEDFLLTGDSIEAHVPQGELERVFAAGVARGVSTARDSLNTDTTDELIRDDWIEGDTIIATFIAVPVGSTDSGRLASADPSDPGPSSLADPDEPNASASADAGDPGAGGGEVRDSTELKLDVLIARGHARAFFREAPAPDSTAAGDPAGGAAAGSAEPPPLVLHYVIGDEVRLFMKNGEIDRYEVDNPTGARLQPSDRSAPPPGAPGPGATPPPPAADDRPPAAANGPPGGNGGAR